MKQVSIVICHHKGNLIDKAVESINKSRNVEYEIIIVTSDKECFERYTGFTNITPIHLSGGPAHKRNIALRFSQYQLIAFFDDDIEVRPYTLYEMVNHIDDSSVGMVFGKLLNMEFKDRFDEAGSFLTRTGFLWARAESGLLDHGQFDSVCPVLAGKSAACMIKKKVFAEVGMFDASYEILAEETDLAWRVWLYGYKVLYVPSSITYHAFNTRFKPADMYTPKRVYFNGCRNYLSMLMTNLGNMEVGIPVTVQFITWFMAGIGFIITGKREAGVNVFRGLGWVLSHIGAILSKRRLVQRNRRVSDKFLLPIIRRDPPISYFLNRFAHYIKTGRHG